MAVVPLNNITIPLLGYAPDLDPAQPGVFSYCLGVESTLRGWKMRRDTQAASTISGSTDLTTGAFVLDGLVSNIVDGTQVMHLAVYCPALTKYKLYWDVAGTLTDISRAGSYTVAGVENFSFCTFGNYVIATNLIDAVQIRDASGSGAFADSAATGIPKAKIAVTFGPPAQQRVMLLHYNDGANTYADGWWVSALGGPTQAWTPDIATGAANNRLYGAGPIRCGIAYRDTIVAWGDRQMWVGRVTDPPLLIDWQKISDELGCCGPYAAKVLNGILYWVGKQGVFSFDGSAIRKAQLPIQQEVISMVASLGTSERLVQVNVDGGGQRLLIALRSSGYTASQTVGTWYSINVLNNKVGARGPRITSLGGNQTVFMCALDNKYAAYATGGASNGTAAVRVEKSNALCVTTDLYGIGINYIGSDVEDTKILRVIPRFAVSGPYQCIDYYGSTMGEVSSNNSPGVTVSTTPYRANFLQSARWHAPRLYFQVSDGNDLEVIDVLVTAEKQGAS